MKYVRFTVKLLPIAFLAILLKGCIGIGVLGVGDLSISSTSGIPTLPYKRNLKPPQGQALSADYVRSQWGEPDYREQIDGGGESWEYRGKNLRWHGLVPMILLPLPLVVPFGHDYVTLVVQDGEARSAKTTQWDFTYVFYCGYAMFFSELMGQTVACWSQIKRQPANSFP